MAAAAAAGACASNDVSRPRFSPPAAGKGKKFSMFGFSKNVKFDTEPIRPIPESTFTSDAGSEAASAAAWMSVKDCFAPQLDDILTPHLNRIEMQLESVSNQVARLDRHCSDGFQELRRSRDEVLDPRNSKARRDSDAEITASAASGVTGKRSSKSDGNCSSPSIAPSGFALSFDSQPGDNNGSGYALTLAYPQPAVGRVSSLKAGYQVDEAFLQRKGAMEEDVRFMTNRSSRNRNKRPSANRSNAGSVIKNIGSKSVERNDLARADVHETAPLIPKSSACGVCWQEGCYGGEEDIEQDLDFKQAGTMLLGSKQRRGYLAETVTLLLEDPESSTAAAIIHFLMPPITLCTVAVTLSQSLQPPLLQGRFAAKIELCIEVFFLLELLLRFAFAPNFKRALASPYNQLDFFASIPLACRAYYGFDPPMEEGSFTHNFLLCAVPVLRTMKVLRRFVLFQLLLQAFTQVFEALPVLLYTLAVFVLVFSSLIYVVEPRDNITCLPEAVWLAIVTMSTVGYGDLVPVSTLGTVIVSVLVVISALYMAMPLGIIGYTFTQIWKDRDRILLMQKTRERLQQWGYTPNDILVLFSLFDENEDNLLDFVEFRQMLLKLRIGIQEDRIAELFAFIDKDGGGSIDDLEFVRAIFPSDFHTIFGQQKDRGQETAYGWRSSEH